MEGSPWSPAGEALRGEVPDGTCVAPDPGRVQMEGSPRPAAGEALRGEVPIWTGWVGSGREGRGSENGVEEESGSAGAGHMLSLTHSSALEAS